jgi:HSP20 family protein
MNSLIKTETRPTPEPARCTPCTVQPAVNIIETKDSFVLEAEMPGVTKEGLEVTLEGSALTLIGRRLPPGEDGIQYLHRESRPHEFRREFQLTPVIDSSRIQAKIEQGLLVLTLPKAESIKPRRITVAG